MRVPCRFIIGLPLGLVLAIALFVGMLYSQLGIPTQLSIWIYDITQKKERLAASVPGPRLLIVAGSSALFSINANLIEQETGYPTINMGTHAGLCLDYHLYQIKQIARPGDTILLPLEYEFYSNGFVVLSQFTDDYMLSRDPGYFRQLPIWEKIEMATHVPFKRFQMGWANRRNFRPKKVNGPPYSAYTPIANGIDCLDNNGDELFNAEENRPPNSENARLGTTQTLVEGLPTENTAGFAVLSDFLKWCQAHQIKVLAAFPCMVHQPVYDGPVAQQAIQTITHFYTSRGVPVLGPANELMLPPDQFFDTMYHMSHAAALKRTERLIPQLKPYLPSPK